MNYVDTLKSALTRALKNWHKSGGRTIPESAALLGSTTRICLNMLSGGPHRVPIDTLLRMAQEAGVSVEVTLSPTNGTKKA